LSSVQYRDIIYTAEDYLVSLKIRLA